MFITKPVVTVTFSLPPCSGKACRHKKHVNPDSHVQHASWSKRGKPHQTFRKAALKLV